MKQLDTTFAVMRSLVETYYPQGVPEEAKAKNASLTGVVFSLIQGAGENSEKVAALFQEAWKNKETVGPAVSATKILNAYMDGHPGISPAESVEAAQSIYAVLHGMPYMIPSKSPEGVQRSITSAKEGREA
ncbi:MAG: hypothetical protein PW734_06305 [Verrucomicrobium sp.]|nr:hypothetical protein [Verrucomicrobium sp.]